MATNRPAARPASGRAASATVIPAVLDAAAQLFAEKGPAGTSLRDVAARADVTYGLVFRHFGTKEKLVSAVLDHLGGAVVDLIEKDPGGTDFNAAVDLHSTVMARATLDGYPADRLQTRFPGTEILIQELAPRFNTDFDARVAAANAIALQLSWRLFQPYLRAATGLTDTPERKIDEAINRILAVIERRESPPKT